MSSCWFTFSLGIILAISFVDAQTYIVTTAYADPKCGDYIAGNIMLADYCSPVVYNGDLTKYIKSTCTSSGVETYQCNDNQCTEGCFKYSTLPTTSECSIAPDQTDYYELTCTSLFPSFNEYNILIQYFDQPNCNGTTYYWGFGNDKDCYDGEYFSCTESSVLLFACPDTTCEDQSNCELMDDVVYGCSADSIGGSISASCS